jgi:hypothetical protein
LDIVSGRERFSWDMLCGTERFSWDILSQLTAQKKIPKRDAINSSRTFTGKGKFHARTGHEGLQGK